MQLDFSSLFNRRPAPPPQPPPGPPPTPSPARAVLSVAGREVPVEFVRKPRARRYILRLRPDGAARVTIPRGGSQAEALAFATRQHEWIAKQLLKPRPAGPAEWGLGTEILFRGERCALGTGAGPDAICFADQTARVAPGFTNLRPAVERHLQRLAIAELVPRVLELAQLHQLRVTRVSVRNQRSRWGSCSARATISLNWRLIQTPPFVRDYIILHELMHLREMNHSARYWRCVAEVCPDYRTAEAWLKANHGLLR